MKKVSNLPSHYASIEDLTLYRWDKYTSTKDNNWFLVDYDGRQKKIECKELTDVENSLQDQYFKAVEDRGFSLKMQKWGKIDWLKTKFMTCNFLLDELGVTVGIESKQHAVYLAERRYNIIQQLKKWGLKFPDMNSAMEDILLINEYRTVLDGIKTQIAILSSELKDDGKKQTQSLHKQLQIATIGLQYPYRLDSKIISVAEWIEICKMLEERSKNN